MCPVCNVVWDKEKTCKTGAFSFKENLQARKNPKNLVGECIKVWWNQTWTLLELQNVNWTLKQHSIFKNHHYARRHTFRKKKEGKTRGFVKVDGVLNISKYHFDFQESSEELKRKGRSIYPVQVLFPKRKFWKCLMRIKNKICPKIYLWSHLKRTVDKWCPPLLMDLAECANIAKSRCSALTASNKA